MTNFLVPNLDYIFGTMVLKILPLQYIIIFQLFIMEFI
jgi:hypothetical protein